jgi:hypothetical protein
MIQRVAAAVFVTVVTVAVIGVVLLTATPLGCGPANAMHIKLSPSSRCVTVASVAPPSPRYSPPGTPTPFPVFNPSPVPAPSNPNPEPASNPNPNPNPVPGSSNPFPDSSSGGFPPFGNLASGPGTPGQTLNCRLAIYAGGPGSGGFVVFPNGNFIADPRSAVAVPSPSPGSASPPPPGYGQGYPGWFGATYDRAYSRWLPVPFAWVTPDGTRYAYPGASGIYVQNVANGTGVELGEGKTWGVIDVEANGVYANTGSTGGLWLLSFAGAVTQVASSGYWQAVGGGFGYGTPTSQVPNGAGNTIIRVDLKNGTTTDFFSLPSLQSSVQGFDPAGNPVIYVQGPNGLQIWIGTAPNVATEIASMYGANFYPQGPVIADIHGLWLAGGNGIALHVAGVGWYAMSSFGGQLAGGCY